MPSLLQRPITKRDFLRGAAAFAGASLLTTPTTAQAQYATVFPLGNIGMMLWVYNYGPGLTYFAPHDDENTSVAAAHTILAQQGGTLIEIMYGGLRNIEFVLDNRRYVADPNRIFSDTGVQQTLTTLGSRNYSETAHTLLRSVAGVILGTIESVRPRRGLLVALHNNTNNNYSIESYLPGGDEARNASMVYQNPQMDSDDFFFTTERDLFDRLQAQNQNVVLQSPSAEDDGSLSVYCAQQDIPYVNVEAQDGHLAAQTVMLATLNDVA